MSVLIPAGFGLASVRYQRVAGGNEATWTFGFDLPGAADVSYAEDIHDVLIPAANICGPANRQTEWAYKGVNTLQRGDPDLYSFSHTVTSVGTQSATCLPPNCAAVVTKSSALAGRSNRGRAYLPAAYLPETAVSPAGVIDSGLVATLQGVLGETLIDLATAGLTMVILHSEAGTPSPVSSFSLQTLIATQRRRLR